MSDYRVLLRKKLNGDNSITWGAIFHANAKVTTPNSPERKKFVKEVFRLIKQNKQ